MLKTIKNLCYTLMPCILSSVVIKNYISAPVSIKALLIAGIYITGFGVYTLLVMNLDRV